MSRCLRLTEEQWSAMRRKPAPPKPEPAVMRVATKVNRFGEPCHAPGRPRGARARVNKYGSTPTSGHASKREAKRAAELRLLEKAGQIRDLREQVEYTLIPKQEGERACKYVADFVYFEPILDKLKLPDYWVPVVEDCKGFRTPVFRIKRKLMLHVHGIRVRET